MTWKKPRIDGIELKKDVNSLPVIADMAEVDPPSIPAYSPASMDSVEL